MFARDSKGCLQSPAWSEKNFLKLEENKQLPSAGELQTYVKSRDLPRGLNKQDTIDAIKKAMALEVQKGIFMVVDSEDGRYEKMRAWKLVLVGVLTYANAPGVVPPPLPPSTDPDWRWIEKEDLQNINMLKVLYEWYDLSYSSGAPSSVQLHKVLNKVTSGRAYNCTMCTADDHMFVMWQIDRSQIKETQQVLIVFHIPVGRDDDAPITVLGAKCSTCTAGENHAGCSHILSAMSGLTLLQMGLIVAGDVGDSGKAWGHNFKVTSAVPV
jgi:hypothetical protein